MPVATKNTALNRLASNALVRLPGALADNLKYELFATLDEFFQKTDIWREDIPVAIVTGEDTYDIEPDDIGNAIVRLLSLLNVNGIPVPATMAEVGTLVLTTVPAASETLTAAVSLTIADPTRTDGYPLCPDWIIQKYSVGILDGLLSRMMTQPAKPYSSDKLAALHGNRFITAMSRAAAEARAANLYGGQAWRFPAFA